MRNAGLEEAQAGIKIAGRNINNLRYADDPYGRKHRGGFSWEAYYLNEGKAPPLLGKRY